MKAIRSMTAEQGCYGISPTRAPEGMSQMAWGRSRPEGYRESKELGWYRGHQCGIHDAYLTLKKDFPKAAGALIKAFGMNSEGTVRL